jgi:integrase
MAAPDSAQLHRHPDSPFWRARFRVWNAAQQQWLWKTQTTKLEDRDAAMAVAREWSRIAQAAGPGNPRGLSREDVLETVNAILRISGHQTIRESAPWNEYADRWIDQKKNLVGAGTWENYKGRVKEFNSHLSDSAILIHLITVHQLRDIQARIRESGISATTVNGMFGTVSAIFADAHAEGLIPRNPALLLDALPSTPNERRAFTPEEIQKLGAYLAADETRQEWLTAFLLGLCTGQRLTDCTRALWTQIDTAAAPYWVWQLTQGKTKKRVEIPLVEPLAGHLKRLNPKGSLYLCPTLATLGTDGKFGLSARFSRLVAEAGVTSQVVEGSGEGKSFNPLTYHSLRHTCNSVMANAGVSQDVRRLILGHASDQMNTRYTHLQISTSGQALADSIGGAWSTPKAAAPATRGSRRKAGSDTAPSSTAKRAARRTG